MIFGTYVRRYFSIRPVFLFYLIFGQLCQIIVAVVPDKTGSPLRIVHTVAGFALAVSLPFLIRELANNRRNKPHHKLFLVLSRVEQATFVIGIGLFIFVNGIAPLGEVLPTTGFDLWVIVITVIISQARPKSSKKLKSAYGSSKY
jgi:Na+/H+ antiporter NhaD/arsenite permease-like protein